jgi:dTDP-4-dehydrorhamnose reductase
VNVDSTLTLARRFSETGAALFFPSTNLVFDGSIPFRQATDPTNPQCEYGRQKVETERGLATLTDKVAVIRFTKIIGPGMMLLKNWAADLRQHRTIHPFSDMVLAPVSLRFATEVILAVMQRDSYGLWQVSAAEDVTYEQMARHLARKIGAPQSLIEPVESGKSGLALEFISKHTTLDTSRLKDELGLAPPSVWETLDEISP